MSEEIKEQKVNFETKIEEAKKLLEELTKPDITLSKSVEVYKKGMSELEQASKLLEEAKLEFEELSK
ncbi:MAG: exodeoxyribonuclease VII small subunit [Sphaerochaetaceae bacterium]|nr:exodeoxyribonuclease VII small subunit [Sphaerochaetaceae bacterium]